jgi:cation diffusion facilitator CzcD-associated flavoprotein CzcO
VDIESGPDKKIEQLTCNFVYLCTGYYDYDKGYTPEWPGMSRFNGRIVHPQKWPEDLDYTGKRVVVIGSGATAVTLVPAMAEKAEHVTMLQRSTTYIVNIPRNDKIANWLREHLPSQVAYSATRWKNVALALTFYHIARRRPEFFKRLVMNGVRHQLGDKFDAKHFTPPYNPWDQRLCLVPDADLFNSIREGKSSVVTDHIETFTETGLQLKSGEHIDADIIVTATGLNLRLMSGLQLVVDNKPIDLSKTMAYKGMMYSDVPNLASAFGYTNASWTLKCDLTGEYICKLLNHMDEFGYSQAMPRRTDPSVVEEPVLDFTSGYVQRALPHLPRQGSKKPWRLNQNYALDLMGVRFSPIDDGTLEFKHRT